MSLISRFRYAWEMSSKQSGLFGGESGQGMLAGILQGGAPPKRGSEELIKMYKRLPWLRAINSKIGTSVAAVTWELYVQRKGTRAVRNYKLQKADMQYRQKHIRRMKAEGEMEEIFDHPLLEMLDKANPAMTGRAARQITQIYLDIKGEVFWVLERNGSGMPIEFWPIPPHWVAETPTGQRPSFRVNWQGWQGYIPETEIIWMKDSDPENPYGRGTGLAESLTDELETDEYASKYVKSWFYNNATPDLLVGVEGADETELKRAKQKWEDQHRGFWRAFRSHWHSGKMTVEQLGHNFQQQQLIKLRQFERDIILQTYGVSPEILGITESSNRATIHEASFIFANWVLVPRLELLRSEMQEKLIPQFDERLILDYVSPVPADRDHNLKAATAAPWSRTLNEWRELQDLPPDDAGDFYRVPGGTSPELQGEPPRLPEAEPVVAPEPEPAVAPVAPEVEPEPVTEMVSQRSVRKVLGPDKVFSILRKLDPEYLTALLSKEFEKLVKEWGIGVFDELGVDITFNILNPLVREHLAEREKKIVGITETTYKILKEALMEGVQAGEGIPSLAKRVSQVFNAAKTYRAKMIARTEVLGSSNFATYEAHRQSGIVTMRAWLATLDEKIREQHASMNGQERSIDKPFNAPDGATAMHPGGFGEPQHDIQCRCTTVAIIKDPEEKRKWLSEEEQAKRWKAFDEKATIWEGRIIRALKKGFQKQQDAIMEALNALNE